MIRFGKPMYLKRGDVVKFVAKPDDDNFSPLIPNGATYMIEKTYKVTYKTGIILSPKDTTLLDFSNETQTSLHLYPTQPDTLYQIVVGFKGGKYILMYPIIPIGHYLYRLEDPTMYPDPKDPNKMWIGSFTAEDSPAKDPKLTLFFVKDYEPFYLQLVNYSSTYDKLCIDFIINVCKIKKVSEYHGKVIEIKKYDMIG